jgi:hypothetical protein
MALSSVVIIEPAPYDLLAVTLFGFFISKGLKIPNGAGFPILLLSLFVLANVVASITSYEPWASLRYMLITLFLVLTWLFFISVIYQNPELVTKVIWQGYLVAAVFSICVGVLSYFHLMPDSKLFLYYGRVSGTFKDANVFGPFLVPVAVYLVSRLTATVKGHVWLNLLTFLFVIFGILLSFSRGAWANLFISMFTYGVLRFAMRKSSSISFRFLAFGVFVTLLAVGLTIFAINTPEIKSLFLERAHLFQVYDIDREGRFSALYEALVMAFNNPIGIGPGLSSHYLITEPHDLYIHVLLETGWLGGIAFCTFIVYSVWRGFQFYRTRSEFHENFIVIFACVIGVLVESLIIHSTHWRHLYLLLAMLWGPMLFYAKHTSEIKIGGGLALTTKT